MIKVVRRRELFWEPNGWCLVQIGSFLGVNLATKALSCSPNCVRFSDPCSQAPVNLVLRSRTQVTLGVVGHPNFGCIATRKIARFLGKISLTDPCLLLQFEPMITLMAAEATHKLGQVGLSRLLLAQKLHRKFESLRQVVVNINQKRLQKLETLRKNCTKVVPQSEEPATATMKRRESRQSDFSAAFLGDSPKSSSPTVSIKQTFPTESFKKAPRVFVTHVSQTSQPAPAHPSSQKPPTKNGNLRKPVLEFSAPDSVKRECHKEKGAKHSPEKNPPMKFPSPETKKSRVLCGGGKNVSLLFSTGECPQAPFQVTLNAVPAPEEPKRFFNSKTGSGNRKMTEEPKFSKEVSLESTLAAKNNLNDKFFAKMDVSASPQSPTKADSGSSDPISRFQPSPSSLLLEMALTEAPCPQLRPHANSAIFPSSSRAAFLEPCPHKGSQGPIKIEMIVSKASIHSTLESLCGKGIADLVSDLTQQAEKMREPRQQIKLLIQGVVSACHPNHLCEISNYGSCVTGLITPYSDMDLCARSQPRIPRTEVNAFLAKLTSHLAAIPVILTVKHIETAAVPILKLTASIGCSRPTSIDLSVEAGEEGEGQSTAFRTTQFVCECIESYPSFKPVVLFLKYALNLVGLHDTYKGGLNAYGLCVLYLAFLRTKKRGNSTNIGRLARDFLRFLTQEFDYTRHAVYLGFGYDCYGYE